MSCNQDENISINDLYSRLIQVIKSEANKTREDIKDEIKLVNTQLCKQIEDHNKKIEHLENKSTALELKCKYLERNSRKNNIIISGLEYDSIETLTQFTIGKLNQLLGINIEHVEINNIYQFKPEKTSPIKVEFVRYSIKNLILNNANKLKGTKIYISHDLCPEDREDSKVLRKHLKEAKAKGLFAKIKGQKLIVNDDIYTVEQLKKLDSEIRNSQIDLNQTVYGTPATQASQQGSQSAPSTPVPSTSNGDVFLENNEQEKYKNDGKSTKKEQNESPNQPAKRKKDEENYTVTNPSGKPRNRSTKNSNK